MEPRTSTRRFAPAPAIGRHLLIAAASAAAGIVIGVSADSLDYRPWSDDSVAPAAPTSVRDRKLSPTGRNGIIDTDPAVLYPAVTVRAERVLSPTGRNGIIDSDPNVRYPTITVRSERKLSPTGRNGIIDSDPAVLYPAE